GQARTRHNCHLSLPESALASRNFAQNVNCLTVRLLHSGDYPCMWRSQALSKRWGTTMRSRKKFAIRLVVALGIAFVGMGAIGTVIAFSAVERARTIAEETITQPFRPPVPKVEYRLSDQQQLRRIFLGH